MSADFRLDGQVAVVVGGTGVLGSAMARGLAAAGAHVAVLGRSSERGRDVIEAIGDGQSLFVPCDATDRASLTDARQQISEAIGAASVLVNAAGGNDPRVTVSEDLRFEDIDGDAWQDSFDLNLVAGVMLPCQVFGPPMVAAETGSIINIASITGHIPLSRVVAYSAAKAGVLSLTQFLAREWAPGVRVNSITPGFFPGEQNRRLLFEEDGSPTERGQQILSHTPMGRFGEPEELVGAALFLASAASSFVTGSDLRVDGGFLSTTI
ncbi:MAG: SDR family oxidoreductase [Gemmatimonadetes bacterium]|jgi:NAD(P)-dependent dehydrogenase (short-subunit alcohol dehydrogenase family)|nr:SDR family oxidoreductase [Gemmatimonadota bacterium]MBT6149886.1 SDR family oxidoreductase [Gemmatimonadota bacterium]MBT7859401.1 SDR family oxidoreductase [Gemmatimonadota bacterium]